MKKRFLAILLILLLSFMLNFVSAQESTSTAMASEIKEQVKCGCQTLRLATTSHRSPKFFQKARYRLVA